MQILFKLTYPGQQFVCLVCVCKTLHSIQQAALLYSGSLAVRSTFVS